MIYLPHIKDSFSSSDCVKNNGGYRGLSKYSQLARAKWNIKIKMAKEPESKKKNYLVKFKYSWRSKLRYIRKSFKGDNFAQCSICRSDFSVGHGGENYITKHNATPKNKESVKSQVKQKKI